ncbi:hypothetical protein J4211_02795 [Candidatus Woesearchaeota archaeon]|nr:hypothetical protein [Candidatus Woesearchaeota archaeon]
MDGFKVPAQIFREANKIDSKITRNSVSDVLRAFTKQGLTKCINPEERKGRIYVLTTKGKAVRKNII